MVNPVVEKHPSIDEIKLFLYSFHQLMDQYGIIFYNRRKNTQALLDLELSAAGRNEILKHLTPLDYYKGPRPDMVNIGAEYWEFGKEVKGSTLYIKLSLGIRVDEPVRCFS
ncbi:MAG: hypothetical protein AAFP92_17190, partial [Bacteroidota bacterium]